MAKKENSRVYMPISDDQLKIVKRLMKQEDKSKAAIVAMIFDDGLKLVDSK